MFYASIGTGDCAGNSSSQERSVTLNMKSIFIIYSSKRIYIYGTKLYCKCSNTFRCLCKTLRRKTTHYVARRHTTSKDDTLRHKTIHYVARRHTTSQDDTIRRKTTHYVTRRYTKSQDVTLRRKTTHYVARRYTTSQDDTLRHKTLNYVARRHTM